MTWARGYKGRGYMTWLEGIYDMGQRVQGYMTWAEGINNTLRTRDMKGREELWAT
jgi:hypothetical protein